MGHLLSRLAVVAVTSALPLAVQACSVTPGASAATVSSPRRPAMLTEPFRPVLACNTRTTLGLEGCGEQRVLADDKQVNEDALVVYGLERGRAARVDFDAAQRAWIAYRRLDCTSQSDAYSKGSLRPVEYVDCLAGEDLDRHADLKLAYRLLVEGSARPPAFP